MNLLRRLLPGFALVMGAFLLSIGLQTLAAWTPPSGSPPSSNAYAPLNTGPTTQTKTGGLNVTGSVGIGTANPRGILHLENSEANIITYDTDGAMSATRPAWKFGSYGARFDISSTADYTTFDSRLTIDATGNVGIGTTGPVGKLEVAATATTFPNGWLDNLKLTGIYPAIWLKDTSSNDGFVVGQDNSTLIFMSESADAPRTNVLAITGAGNVGIGTTVPGQKLDVQGGYVRSGTGFCIGASCITSWPSSGTGDITAVYAGSGLSGGSSSGDATLSLGSFGCSSGNAIQWVNGSSVTCASISGGGSLPAGSNGQTIRNSFGTWIANSNIFDTSNYVGIGTTNPGHKLDVSGNIHANGYLRGLYGGSGAALLDRTGNNILSFDWTGSKLDFWVDSTNVGSLGGGSTVTNGYTNIGKVLLQWGSGISTTDTSETFYFPTAFPNAALNVQLTRRTANAGRIIPVTSVTNSYFVVNRDSDVDGSQPFFWLAVGY